MNGVANLTLKNQWNQGSGLACRNVTEDLLLGTLNREGNSREATTDACGTVGITNSSYSHFCLSCAGFPERDMIILLSAARVVVEGNGRVGITKIIRDRLVTGQARGKRYLKRKYGAMSWAICDGCCSSQLDKVEMIRREPTVIILHQ
ncbi:hypothetical protein RRG08_061568 [Elysia crispata]|uniref:Uncharacterized protein n=1 Tax=Elysia crispata TaxID=231223 RepID=A0AAE1D4U3_9GAST|nr:hypothetical protein RRG08_061568 [Elysia crispata]